ncbi:ribonuclease P protein component [Limnobacter sp.]|uniref:ribonuclease P protein component n=1 Tax=Limnobacter sp. TaxID=2003368 RepID=UPI003515FA4E
MPVGLKSGQQARAIGRSDSFGPLLKIRPLAKTPRLMLHGILKPGPTQFGVLIPKRLAKRAVDRNTLKRIVRHACYKHLAHAQGQFLVRFTKPVQAVGHSDRAAWWTEIQQLLSAGLQRVNLPNSAANPPHSPQPPKQLPS